MCESSTRRCSFSSSVSSLRDSKPEGFWATRAPRCSISVASSRPFSEAKRETSCISWSRGMSASGFWILVGEGSGRGVSHHRRRRASEGAGGAYLASRFLFRSIWARLPRRSAAMASRWSVAGSIFSSAMGSRSVCASRWEGWCGKKREDGKQARGHARIYTYIDSPRVSLPPPAPRQRAEWRLDSGVGMQMHFKCCPPLAATAAMYNNSNPTRAVHCAETYSTICSACFLIDCMTTSDPALDGSCLHGDSWEVERIGNGAREAGAGGLWRYERRGGDMMTVVGDATKAVPSSHACHRCGTTATIICRPGTSTVRSRRRAPMYVRHAANMKLPRYNTYHPCVAATPAALGKRALSTLLHVRHTHGQNLAA